jgi:outer membrane receptor protein involved in Fe transport
VNDTDPHNISYGNPELVPEKSHNFSYNYSFFSPKYTLNASASYMYINNAIENYEFIDPADPDVKRRTYGNIGRKQSAGLYVSGGWTPNKILRFNLNGGMNYIELKSVELDASNSGLTGSCNLMAMVTLPKDFRINAMAYYMSGQVMLQGKQTGFLITGLTANKDFLKKKMTVSLSLTNPFNKSLKIEMSTLNDYFERNITVRQPIREGRISVSYRFGTMKEAIKKVQRSITNDDVKSGGEGGSGGGVSAGVTGM